MQLGNPFKGWEKSEKGGALKSMFFWKMHTKSPLTATKPHSNDEDQENSSKLETTKSPPPDKNCNEDIDRTVYKVLTRRMGKRSNAIQRVAWSLDKWRGPREELSEVPVQRKKTSEKWHPSVQVF